MFCYRRSGHNEMDLPEFTQPLMYQKIKSHPTTLNIYEKKLIEEGVLTTNEVENEKSTYIDKLNQELKFAKSYKPNKADWLEGSWKGITVASIDARRGKTGINDCLLYTSDAADE